MRLFVVLFLLIGSSSVFAAGFDQQILFWEKRVALDPDDWISPTKLGELYLKRARETGELSANVEAEKNFRIALKRAPDYHPAIVSLASACIAQHKFLDALAQAERAASLKPDDAYSQAVLGDVCLELGKISRAEVAYKKSLQITPALATQSRMAYLYWIKGDIAMALQSYEAALDPEQNGTPSRENLAWCHLQKGEFHFRTGDFLKTQSEYSAAALILPENYSVHEHLAELHASQAQYDDAIALYRKVIAKTS
ncbi:MAG: tetratricopeptide repeat protein [Verrucomicrobiota bacterium]